ncbi:MAG: hypothetical protein J5J06_07305 [Phycisphaerae bacterium]|nr:hypothetical protein [Phycisphaerae bacterium]
MQREVLEKITDSRVKVLVVWTPVLREDDRHAAVKAVEHVADSRAMHFWDPDKSLGLALGETVVLPRGRKLAWDVYFVFDARSEWGDKPPEPRYWMHQLGNDERTLDGDKLREAIERCLREVR